METIYVPINKDEWLSDAIKRENKELGIKKNEFIPSNIILDKTLPGLGATYMELHSKRNSIIIEPNVPVILGKIEENEDETWLAVWYKCTESQIKKHLQSSAKYKKIICTPEGFRKIRTAANKVNINIYKEYFCLMDECEKFVQDADFRKRITQPISDFLKFEGKAMVSATPLPMRHPELKMQEFIKYKVKPEYDYKKDVELIVTNSYDKTIREKFNSLTDSLCVCIFLNSTDGINKIIHSLELTDYKVFCSEKSVEKLKEREFENVSENLELPLAKYNFFTCRFYSALDIKIPTMPDIVMLTNLNEAVHTIIDPFTEAVQIYGRFRNKSENGNTFNSFTHITNVNERLSVKTEAEISDIIREFEITYQTLKKRHSNAIEEHKKQAIATDIAAVTYKDLLDEYGDINHFAIDNLYNEERVKGYYTSAEKLLEAYTKTEHFNITYTNAIEHIGEDDILRIKKSKTDIDKRKKITLLLDALYQSAKEDSSLDKTPYLEILKKEEEGEYTIEAYQKIGKNGLEEANYTKRGIDSLVKKYDKEIHRFLPHVLKDIKAEFELNVPIEKEVIKPKIESIYHKYNIKYKVKLKTIEDYYIATQTNSSKPYKYTLKSLKPKLVRI